MNPWTKNLILKLCMKPLLIMYEGQICWIVTVLCSLMTWLWERQIQDEEIEEILISRSVINLQATEQQDDTAFTFTGHSETPHWCSAIRHPVVKLINTELSGSWLTNKDNLWPIIFKDKRNYNLRDDKHSKDVIWICKHFRSSVSWFLILLRV